MVRKKSVASYGNFSAFGDLSPRQKGGNLLDSNVSEESGKRLKPNTKEKRSILSYHTGELVSRRSDTPRGQDIDDINGSSSFDPAQIDRAELQEGSRRIKKIRDPNNQWHKRKRAMRRATSANSNRPKSKHTIRNIILTLLLAVVGVGGYFVWQVGSRAVNMSNNVFDGGVIGFFQKKERLQTDDGGRTNILIFGTAEDDEGGMHEGANLTDSLMVVSLNQDTKDAIMVSIPRDLWVKLDSGCVVGYQARINTAFFCASNDGEDEEAGAEALMNKIGEVTGLNIHYYAHINFTAVVEAVDAVGGVEVVIESEDERGILDRNFDWKCNYQCYYVKYANGPTGLMDGEHALALMRARNAAGGYGLPNSNFDREKNQQKVLTSLFKKAADTETIFDFNKIIKLMEVIGGNLRTNINTNEVRTFVDVGGGVDIENIKGVGLVELTANTMAQNGNYEKYYSAAVFDADVREKAKALFDEYRSGGIILNGSFADNEWKLTNQLQNTGISFNFHELNYHKIAEPWLGCNFDLFIDCVKTYVMFRLGNAAIGGIRNMVNSFRLITEVEESRLINSLTEHHSHLAELLSVLPGGNVRRDAILEALDERQWEYRTHTGKKRQRVLSELNTYFAFNDALQEFWISTADDEKLFWFPLYLWWTLTAILPLRTTEFLLTPRDCLGVEHGRNLITLRRTLLKGGNRKLAYRIDKDYETVRYIIPDKMAGEILWYLKATAGMKPTSLSTMFVQEPHYLRFGKKPNTSLGYYTYGNLSTCLRYFQDGVMDVDAEAKIRLGDTRHLAMISLILSGGSPLICKELAGHNDINISSHYYSNISSFIECATFEAHRKSRAWRADLIERKMPARKDITPSIAVEGGFCDSIVYGRGEIYDCIKIIGADGELGNCRYCPHFIDGKSGVRLVYANPHEQKERVDSDSEYLLQTIEAVRRGIGLPEDIRSALLRLQQSGVWYGRCLQNELEVKGDGETEKNND